MLDDIKAVHSSEKMSAHVRSVGGLVRKDAVTSIHPLVRIHPVTGKRCLFINGEFITKLQGLKEAESKWLQEFLLNHIITGHDFQARVKWQPKTIVLFDNRNTIRKFAVAPCGCSLTSLDSAIVDYIDENGAAEPRHIFRLCAMTEVPVSVS
jgi:sulfonate dioxygenase